MSNKPNDKTKGQKDLDGSDKSIDWAYWNRMPVLTLNQAVCLTLNAIPGSIGNVRIEGFLHPSPFDKLSAIAQAHILNGSLNYLDHFEKNLRVTDWLQLLQANDISFPDEWRPVGLTFESTENAGKGKSSYTAHYEEAVNIAIAMAQSADITTPTRLKQLYLYVQEHPDECPVNCGGEKNKKISTIQRNVRDGGGNPLKDSRFIKALAQNL